MSTTTYRSATTTAFLRGIELYSKAEANGHNFWFLGNALHAGLRAVIATGTQNDKRLLFAGVEAYDKVVQGDISTIWRDDFGWWGGAFCTAIRHRVELGYGDPKYDPYFKELHARAVFCWEQLNANWRDTYYNPGEDHSEDGADIKGGAFNVAPTDPPYPPDPPAPPLLAGRNSVTNAGFWMLSFELAAGDDEFAERAKALQNWVYEWITRGENRQPGLLDKRGLVLERPTGNHFASKFTWTGDQGAMAIAALRQRERDMPPPYTDTLGPKLVIAARKELSIGGILTEELVWDWPFDEYMVDYATGKGIFMRYLADVCDALGAKWTEDEFHEFITKNASSVWNLRDSDGNLPYLWGPAPYPPFKGHDLIRPLVFHMSALDALSAATRFWPDDTI